VSRVGKYLICLGLLVVFLSGCSTVRVSERYLQPGVVNMAGRKTVVLDVQGQDQRRETLRAVDTVEGHLRQTLFSNGFTVLDRSAIDVKTAEAFFTGDSEELTGASTLIKARLLRNSVLKEKEKDTRKTENSGTYNVYRTIGRGTVEVAYLVIDLGTSETLYSETIVSSSTEKTDWSKSGYSQIDSESVLSRCYAGNPRKLVAGKLVPKTVHVSHDLYANKKYPTTLVGVAYLHSQNFEDAFEQFEIACDFAKQDMATKPKVLGLLLYNLAVAKEMSGDYQSAGTLYAKSAGLGAVKTGTENPLARCRRRRADISRLSQQLSVE